MSCECASLRMEVLSQKSEILSQRSLMVQWFETLMTELQDVKKQNSELKDLFNASNHHQQESIALNSEPSILEGFSANGSLETNGNSVQNVLECQPEFPQETSNPFAKLFEVAPELEKRKLLVETDFQLTEDDQKIFPPEIEPAEVNSEYPLLQLERFESATIENKETSRAFANEDTSTVPKNKSKAVHRAESSSPKRQDLDAARGNKPTTRNIGKYRCVKSPYQTWNPSTLKAHSVTHTGERPFQCSVCNKGLASKTALLSHILTHTGKKPFECTICKNSFARKEHFMRHNLIHTGEKPFSCDVCDYQCRHPWSLIAHKRTHTGEKPFECDQCDFRSSRKTNLVAHRRIHSGEKPFQCDMCDYRAAEKGNLIRHKKLLNHEK